MLNVKWTCNVILNYNHEKIHLIFKWRRGGYWQKKGKYSCPTSPLPIPTLPSPFLFSLPPPSPSLPIIFLLIKRVLYPTIMRRVLVDHVQIKFCWGSWINNTVQYSHSFYMDSRAPKIRREKKMGRLIFLPRHPFSYPSPSFPDPIGNINRMD